MPIFICTIELSMCSYECRVQSSTKINVERSENERGTWYTTVCNGKQCVIHGTRVHVTKEKNETQNSQAETK